MSREVYYLLSGWLTLLSLIGGFMVLAFQFKAYRATGHKSLRLLLVSTVLTLVSIPLGLIIQYMFWKPIATSLYWLMAMLTTVEMIVGVLGVRFLLLAFQSSAEKRQAGGA